MSRAFLALKARVRVRLWESSFSFYFFRLYKKYILDYDIYSPLLSPKSGDAEQKTWENNQYMRVCVLSLKRFLIRIQRSEEHTDESTDIGLMIDL